MTYREITEQLQHAGIESAAWDAECLIRHYFNVSRAALLSDPTRTYESAELLCAIDRRCRREPLQYLLGEWEFYRQTYEVGRERLHSRSVQEPVRVKERIEIPLITDLPDGDLRKQSGHCTP